MAPHASDPWLVDLYRNHYRDLVRLAALLTGDRPTAEEAVQDAFVAVARRGALRLDDPDAAPAYLRSAVLNHARSALRRRGVRERHQRDVGRAGRDGAATAGADASALEHEETSRIMAALDRLSDRQREVLILRYYADLSEAEIATHLGVSAGSVKTHAHRGLRALAELLEER